MYVQRLRRFSGIFLIGAVALAGCSQEEEKLELDPGASPFYPGPNAAKPGAPGKTQTPVPGSAPSVAAAAQPAAAPASVEASDPSKPLRADEVEKHVRIAQRHVQKGEIEKAGPLLDQVLAVETIHREALNGRAAVWLQQAKSSLPLAERKVDVDAALKLVRKLRSAYELPKKAELALYAAALSRKAELLVAEKKYDEAVTILQEATDAGLDGLYWAERDPSMKELRTQPKFQAAFDALKATRLAEARSRLHGQVDKPLPIPFDFKLEELEGKPVKLADFKGKVVVCDLWGTWCGPCREALPRVIELSKKFESSGLAVVGLTYEKSDPKDPQTVKTVKEFVKQASIPYPVLMGDEATARLIPGFKGFPTTVVLDRNGKPRLFMTENDERTLDVVQDVVLILLAEKADGK